MHILANGAGRNLRSTIMNHFKIRIMKEQILKKIENVIIHVKSKASAESAYNGLINSSPRMFYILSGIYGLNEEEQNFAWSAGIA